MTADIVELLMDILEELRLVHTTRSTTQLDKDTVEFVKQEWHKLTNILDRGCIVIYVLLCSSLCGGLWYSIGDYAKLEDIKMPLEI